MTLKERIKTKPGYKMLAIAGLVILAGYGADYVAPIPKNVVPVLQSHTPPCQVSKQSWLNTARYLMLTSRLIHIVWRKQLSARITRNAWRLLRLLNQTAIQKQKASLESGEPFR